MDGLGSLVTAGGKAFLIALFFLIQIESKDIEDRVKSLKKKEEKIAFLGAWGYWLNFGNEFWFIGITKTTLDVRDYELKVRMVTRMDCFYLAMFRYREQVWNKQGYLTRDEVLINEYERSRELKVGDLFPRCKFNHLMIIYSNIV